jgi:molybdopterin converting factor small subunit
VRILLFSTARTALGRGRLDWPVPAEGLIARELLDQVTDRHPALRRILTSSRILRNGEVIAGRATRFLPGDELAVHPPYGGG